jgi:hypothetical protein
MTLPIRCLALSALAALVLPALPAPAQTGSINSLQSGFVNPPDSTRPTVRWWWFGPAVVEPELQREMQLMKAGGFGGFEVQPTYPLALDGQYPDLKNLKFLSPEFFSMLGFAASQAASIGLRMDLTLGSGWPYGGPMFTRDEAAQSIRQAGPVTITPGQTSVSPPPSTGRNSFNGPPIAALLGPITDAAPGASQYLPLTISNGTAQIPADLHGATQVTFFTYAPAGLMNVKRPAYGAEGFIIDHYSTASVAKFIQQIAQPEVTACGDNSPYSVFCDSLEITGEGWTPDFLAEFKQRRGYDLTPLLPALFDVNFPHSAEVREDYGRTVNEIFNDNFVSTFTKFAHDNHTLFRIQAYGTPPTTLSTWAHADLDEGEYYGWKTFSGTRWAASASHLLGRPVASSETFTWLHSPVFMAAPLDVKAESNLDFLNGINQILCHGWPYTAPGVEYPGWRFYAAAVFDEKNPWWIVMPDLTTYLARASFMLRQGQPANDVALYLPEEDAFAEFTPTNLQIAGASSGFLNRLVGNYVEPIISSGYDLDFVDDGLISLRGQAGNGTFDFGNTSLVLGKPTFTGVKYPVVILPNVQRIPLATYQKFQQFANSGGLLIAVGNPPSQAPGYLATDADNQAIRDISQGLFSGPNAKGIVVADDAVAQTLLSKLRPDVTYSKAQPDLGFVHRHTDAGEVYFLVNTSDHPISDTAVIRTDGLQPEWWNPVTGVVTPATVAQHYAGATAVPVSLAPYDAQFLVFTNRTLPPTASAGASSVLLDLSTGWDLTFKNASPEANPGPVQFDTLHSWTDSPTLQYFSGVVSYTKQFDLPAEKLTGASSIFVDFGPGQPTVVPGGTNGMRANYAPPVADAAIVYVNDQRAGSVWCPPYVVDITKFLKPGPNTIRIDVANRAINYMADLEHHPLPDYTELDASRTYGAPPNGRFQAQDMNRIEPLPSGLLGAVRIVAGNPGG